MYVCTRMYVCLLSAYSKTFEKLPSLIFEPVTPLALCRSHGRDCDSETRKCSNLYCMYVCMYVCMKCVV